jgi:hypothetical protein
MKFPKLEDGFEFKIEEIEHIPYPMEKGVIYISHRFQFANHCCPCGCGGEGAIIISIPNEKLDEEQKKHRWGLTYNNDKTITIEGSILNRGCNAHYFIRHNKLVWC